MASNIQTVRRLAALRRAVAVYRQAGETVALVPTMGALHAGHLSLVRRARRRAGRVVVSIFVNPAQFAPTEDFASYPRTFKGDLAALAELDTDLVWAPARVSEMYPAGFATQVLPAGPAVAGLEDAHRPHFFAGVATIVAKLLLQCGPDFAVFGEKDYQQLRVVERMVADLNIPVTIIGAPTIREPDGLAMSSRNVYLTPQQRVAAPALYRALARCAEEIRNGRRMAAVMQRGAEAIKAAGLDLDYLEARHAETLQPAASRQDPVRLLAAAKLGRIRLIDNVGV